MFKPMAPHFGPRGLVDFAEQSVRSYITAVSWSERQIFRLIRSGMKIAEPPVETEPKAELAVESRVLK